MKTEGLSAEEAAEIIRRGGEVADREGDIYTLLIQPCFAPYRVVTPPPDAEPVVTAEEFLEVWWQQPEDKSVEFKLDNPYEYLKNLKAARAPKPEPQPIRTLAEALACEWLRMVDECGYKGVLHSSHAKSNWGAQAVLMAHLDGYDAGRRVYDATEEQAK